MYFALTLKVKSYVKINMCKNNAIKQFNIEITCIFQKEAIKIKSVNKLWKIATS